VEREGARRKALSEFGRILKTSSPSPRRGEGARG
jgi:hypothetical protein